MVVEEKIAVLFPGQGSQYVGMGESFLAEREKAAILFKRAEELSGLPLKKFCLEGPMDVLTRTLHLQPAVTVVNMVVWDALREAGVSVDCMAGHSLGEYSALYAAGVLSGDDTLRLVSERGRLMEREAARHPGGMLAVVGLEFEPVAKSVADLGTDHVVAANYNSAKQIVLSGDHDGLKQAAALVEAIGGRAIALKVSGAWHSPLVAGAVDDFQRVMAEIPFQPPTTPVFFNVTGGTETDPTVMRRIMASQIASMVRWLDIIHAMLERRVTVFIEVGPKNVLSGLLRKIVPADYTYRSYQIDTPAKLADCLAGLREVRGA